jgi:hypothetical protein
MKYRTGITIILLWCAANCFAQLNESDTAKFQMRVSLTGNYQQGNVEVLNIKSKMDFSFSMHRSWVFKSQNSSLYQAFYTKKADNDVFSRNYLYYNPQHKGYPFAIAYISTNFRRKIGSRYFTGAGITLQAVNTKKTVLKISASAVYESTVFKSTAYNYAEYNGADKISLWRGTLYAGGWAYILQKRVRLYYDSYWQPAFNNRHNYRTQFDIGADASLWKGLSFNTLFALTHENVTVNNILKNDKMLTFGLAYAFKVK